MVQKRTFLGSPGRSNWKKRSGNKKNVVDVCDGEEDPPRGGGWWLLYVWWWSLARDSPPVLEDDITDRILNSQLYA